MKSGGALPAVLVGVLWVHKEKIGHEREVAAFHGFLEVGSIPTNARGGGGLSKEKW